MSAIITTKFRFQSATNLTSTVGGLATDVFYLFIGRTFPWEIDSNPPIPDDTQYAENDAKQNLVAMKKISSTSVSRCIPRYNWISGNEYSEYDDRNSLLSTLQYFVVTDELGVYKCIKKGPTGSEIKPVGISSTIGETLSDGYQWKYMFTLSGNDVARFLTSTFISAKTLIEDDTTAQWAVQTDAIDGAIHRIKVTSGGSGYTAKPTITIVGDGQNCTIQASDITMSSGGVTGSVTEILVGASRCGTGYNIADVIISAPPIAENVATARAIISPAGGHGSNPVDELGGFYVMVDVQLIAADGTGDFPVDNDFRQIGVIANPKLIDDTALSYSGRWITSHSYIIGDTVKFGNSMYVCSSSHTSSVFADDLTTHWIISAISTNSTLNALSEIEYSSLTGVLTKDNNVLGSGSNAKGYVDSVDLASHTIKFHQNATTGFDTFNIGESISIVSLTGSVTATATIVNIKTSEYELGSGTIVYIENLSPVNRSISQTEDIKLVLEM